MGGVGWGGLGAVRFRPIESMRCPRSRQIQPVGGGCCPLSANLASGGCAYVNFYYRGGCMAPSPPPGTPMIMTIKFNETSRKLRSL